ncbi:SurA N-terminal domain-containing protein [Actinosynnema sp. CA-248983]
MRTVQRRFTLVGAAVALLVAGCGTGPSQVGAAAIIGDSVIPLEEVQQRLDALRKKEPEVQKLQEQHKFDEVARLAMGTYLQQELVKRAAEREGVSVSEEAVTRAVDDAGGAETASEGTLWDATTYRDWAKTQLLAVELGRKHVDRMEVTFDYFYAKDDTEAKEKAKQVEQDPAKMAEFVKAAPASPDGRQLSGLDAKVHSAEVPRFATTPLFAVDPGTVVAFAPDPGNAQWFVAYVKDFKDDVRPRGQVSTEQLAPRALEGIGMRLAQRLAGDPQIKVNPRFGVWDPSALTCAASEETLSGYQAAVRSKS